VNPGGFAGYEADLWGMTACNGPARRVSVNGARLWVRGYAARGAPDGLDDGTLAPWAPLACLPFAPQEALRATRRILARFPEALDEHHCFVDAIHPGIRSRTDGVWSAQRSSALDQGLLVTSIENHRSGLVRGLFTRSAWSGVKRL
ncbi:hypothetical protein BO068_005064, partial [Escherichia coli]|nr:hypothetical protein [Escherichia coli]